jgi:histidinol phosphatase-like PHP family hydrolase
MHSEWSDGAPTLGELVEACRARGYAYAAVTDHSHGLRIAGGMSMAEVEEQHAEIDRINRAIAPAFRLFKGVEANIAATGELDLSDDEASRFEIVLASPHSKLRIPEDQTGRLLAAVANPHVRVLGHPRGRIRETRRGVIADWDRVFHEAAMCGVAVEIDGDPARQDLDYELAARARSAGCIFCLDSDAHATDQLDYAETAVAHARLAEIAPIDIVNCWDRDRVLAWIADRSSASRARAGTELEGAAARNVARCP